MKFTMHLKRTILLLDEKLAIRLHAANYEEGKLLCFLFHGLFENGEELRSGALDPQQGITVEMFRVFISHFREQGYSFVSPRQILEGLPLGGRYLLLTFDDGYFNNLRALPVMKEFDAPAVFFISSDHVQEGKAFWWDVVFRQGRKHAKTEKEIRQTVAGYKRLKTEEVESDLRKKFGNDASRPIGDLDRPFTPDELREFASHRLVSLGNHTKNHAILSNYNLSEVREQIQGAQDAIAQMTGKIPQVISYPNGNSSPEIEQAARELGLPLGVVVRRGQNRLPLKIGAPEAMTLKRFILWGDRGIEAQCKVSRADLSLSHLLEGLAARTTAR
jgi:peptidoglycan/xylan/chitin deacetylase (PgdA/CDA1 family)